MIIVSIILENFLNWENIITELHDLIVAASFCFHYIVSSVKQSS